MNCSVIGLIFVLKEDAKSICLTKPEIISFWLKVLIS